MATTCMTLSALLMALISSSATATNPNPPTNHDLLVATEEMQRANHFTFVLLINMAPATLIQGNVTLLMPTDRTLAQTPIPENTVVDFLLRHSIPSPLLFEDLAKLPTGSVIPTEEPEFALRVSNNGRRSFYLNNVQIVSRNLCTAGSSIRCHGIDGVVEATMQPGHNTTTTLPPPTCPDSSSPAAAAIPLINLTPIDAPPPTGQNGGPLKSGSSQPLRPFGGVLLGFMITIHMPNLSEMVF